jgi:hypothetical protein
MFAAPVSSDTSGATISTKEFFVISAHLNVSPINRAKPDEGQPRENVS